MSRPRTVRLVEFSIRGVRDGISEVTAPARHPTSGLIVGKDGLDSEIGRIVATFRDSGHFTLMHDLASACSFRCCGVSAGQGASRFRHYADIGAALREDVISTERGISLKGPR